MKTIITCLLLVFASTGSAFAQSASETARAHFDFLSDNEYRKAAECYSPGALREIRKMLNNTFEALPEEAREPFYKQFFGSGASKESLAKKSDAEFFAGFSSSLAKQGRAVGIAVSGKVEMLGEVPESENVVHVLTRQFSAAGPPSGRLEVISFRKSDGSWNVMLTEEMKSEMAGAPKKAFQMGEKALRMHSGAQPQG